MKTKNHESKLEFILILIIITFVNGFAEAQVQDKEFNIDAVNIWADKLPQQDTRIWVLGENHHEYNTYHQLGLILYLNKKRKMNLVGLESPKAYEFLYNSYLITGDDRIFMLIDYYDSRRIKKNEYDFIRCLRNYNLNEGSGNPVHIFCYDVSSTNIVPTILCLQYLFKKQEGIDQLGIYDIIMQDTKEINKFEGRNIANVISDDFRDHDSIYKTVFKDEYFVYRNIIEGMQIAFSKEYKLALKTWQDRESYMLRNIEKELVNNSPILILCGQAHASKLANDSNYFSHGFDSFTASLREKYSEQVLTIGTFYNYRKNDKSMTFKSQLYSNSFWQKSNENYFVLDQEALALHPNVSKRFDIVLAISKPVKINNCLPKDK